jgi:hypothetical protein
MLLAFTNHCGNETDFYDICTFKLIITTKKNQIIYLTGSTYNEHILVMQIGNQKQKLVD